MNITAWLVWVSFPYATFGIVVKNGVVTEAAPYVYKKSIGRLGREVVKEFQAKGAKIVVIPDPREGTNDNKNISQP